MFSNPKGNGISAIIPSTSKQPIHIIVRQTVGLIF